MFLEDNKHNFALSARIAILRTTFRIALLMVCVFPHPAGGSLRGDQVTAIKAEWTKPLSATDTLIIGYNNSDSDLFCVDKTGLIKWSTLTEGPCGVVANGDYVIFGDAIPVVSPVWHPGPIGIETLRDMRGWPLTCLDAKSGRRIWTRPLMDAGVPLCITKDGYWSIKLDNPRAFFGEGSKARESICLNSSKTGLLIKKWRLPIARQSRSPYGYFQGESYQLMSTHDSLDRTCINLEIIYPSSRSLIKFTHNKLSLNAAVVQMYQRCPGKSEYKASQMWQNIPVGKTVPVVF